MTDLFYNWKFVVFDPPSPISLTPLPPVLTCQPPVFCINELVLGFFVFVFFKITHIMRSYGICFSLSDMSLSRLLSRSIYVVSKGKSLFFFMSNSVTSHFLYPLTRWML